MSQMASETEGSFIFLEKKSDVCNLMVIIFSIKYFIKFKQLDIVKQEIIFRDLTMNKCNPEKSDTPHDFTE